jgi:type VI secretion system secreted protein Hcp
MFLKVQGVTGESGDADHKDEIEVVSWSWGMQASTSAAAGHVGEGRTTMSELEVVKHVDKSSTTLMMYLRSNKLVAQAKLTVRKAGQTPLEYLKVELQKVRITSIKVESQGTELVERVRLGFAVVTVTYTPQDSKGGPRGASQCVLDAYVGV